MPQEQTEKTMTPDTDLKDGKVRPKSKVKVLFLNSKHHRAPYTVEEVHPALAEKLVETGKAEYTDGKLTKEQKDANKEALMATAKNRGRVAKPAEDNAAGDDDKDLLGDKGNKDGKADGKGGNKGGLKETNL